MIARANTFDLMSEGHWEMILHRANTAASRAEVNAANPNEDGALSIQRCEQVMAECEAATKFGVTCVRSHGHVFVNRMLGFMQFGELFNEVIIPGHLKEVCDQCFFNCKRLSRVVFGCSNCLERLGYESFAVTGLREIVVPASVREICDRCFYGCKSLVRVTFGSSSCLKRIGAEAFKWTPLGVTDEEYLTPTPD